MGHPNEPSPSSGDATERNSVNHKKRLSRRQQRARKKQRKQQLQSDTSSSAACDNLKSTAEKEQTHVTKELAARKSNETDLSSAKDPWQTCALQPNIPYCPTRIPDLDSNSQSNDNIASKKESKTLGKWFPKASVFKSQPSSSMNCTLLLFYQYKSPVVWPERKVALLMKYLQAVAQARPLLGGRLRVAPEGINATLSCGDAPDGTNGRTILEHFTKELIQFDSVFEQTDFKYLPAQADRHFKDLKILPVQELVFYGLQEAQAPLSETGIHLDAKDFHSMLQDTSKETVVVDVRNHYEAALGRFDGQEKIPGAAIYTDPLMRKSTDFPEWVEKAADDLKGKRVMLYCTGGVRCERASAYLKRTMGDSLQGVYQLQGGIERYLQSFPDGGYWRGSNFVFDKREAVSVDDPNGQGGVIRKKKCQPTKNVDTKCCLCDKPWDRYVGKKKCDCCGVPVLMCDTCMTAKKRKESDDKTSRKMARCPLCVAQNITVPLEEVEYTNNGVKSKCKSEQGKAAPSVLKWGGGHASDKKLKRRKSRGNERESRKT
jgi:predicted sulfurtransferase